jgi:hypothetical protein
VSSIQRENHPIEEPNHTNPIQLNQLNKLNQVNLSQTKPIQSKPTERREESIGGEATNQKSQQREKPSNKRNQ